MPEYFELDVLPGVQMFRCERHHATMQPKRCADMWRQANGRGAPERLDACRNCPIGAEHAGVREISLSPLRGMSICARCHQGATRLIRGHLCVSCYNRQREYLLGRNARGSAPKMHPPLHPLEIRFKAGGELRSLAVAHATGPDELVVAALRDTGQQVTFGFRGTRPRFVQGELFG